MNRQKTLLAVIGVILALIFINGYFFIKSAMVQKELKGLHTKEEAEIKAIISEEREKLKKGYGEKYKDTLSSYENTFKDLEGVRTKLKKLRGG